MSDHFGWKVGDVAELMKPSLLGHPDKLICYYPHAYILLVTDPKPSDYGLYVEAKGFPAPIEYKVLVRSLKRMDEDLLGWRSRVMHLFPQL